MEFGQDLALGLSLGSGAPPFCNRCTPFINIYSWSS